MTHTRIRKFNTKETYPEQSLDNDLCQAVVAGNTVYLRGQVAQDLDTRENVDEMFGAIASHGLVTARAGAYKPRTSPYDFQGLGADCLPWVFESAGQHGIRVVSMEVTDARHIEEIGDDRVSFTVTGCALVRLSMAAGHPELGPTFCVADGLFFESIRAIRRSPSNRSSGARVSGV